MGLLERLKAGTDNRKTIIFHGESIVLRVLSEAELQECRALADQDRQRLALDDETIMLETVLRQLYKAGSDAEGAFLAETFEAFKRHISRADREFLVEEYLGLEAECSPRPETLTDEEFETLKEEVKKSPDMLLNSLNIGLLRKLCIYLASRQRR